MPKDSFSGDSFNGFFFGILRDPSRHFRILDDPLVDSFRMRNPFNCYDGFYKILVGCPRILSVVILSTDSFLGFLGILQGILGFWMILWWIHSGWDTRLIGFLRIILEVPKFEIDPNGMPKDSFSLSFLRFLRILTRIVPWNQKASKSRNEIRVDPLRYERP